MLWLKVDLNILVVFIINTDTNTALAEVLYQRRILNVAMSQGLMDARTGASHTTGGPGYTSHTWFLINNINYINNNYINAMSW